MSLSILEVIDDLPPNAGVRGRRALAADLVEMLAGLPPHPKWAVVFRGQYAPAKAQYDRLAKLRARYGLEVKSGDGTVYVRRAAPGGPSGAPSKVSPPAVAVPPPAAVPPPVDPTVVRAAKPTPVPAPAAAPVEARPKVIGWIGMPATRRMDFFVASWTAHAGNVDAVAAELDVSRSTVEQWRRNARTQGRLR